MKDKFWKVVGLGAYGMSIGIVLLPLIGVATSKYVKEIELIHFKRVASALGVSLSTSIVAMIVIILVGLGTSYCIAMYDFKWKKYVSQLLAIPLMLPPAVIGIFLLLTFGKQGMVGKYLADYGIQLTFSSGAVILVQIFIGLPFFIKTIEEHINTVDSEILESAQLEGCTKVEAFYYILLPLVKYGIINGLLMTSSRVLAEFGGTMLFAGNIEGKTQTLPLAIYSAMESSMSEALLIAFILLLLALGLTISVTYLTHRKEA